MRPATLRVRIDQSWQYICKFMDPEGVYKQLREDCVLNKGENGLILSVIDPTKVEVMHADVLSESDLCNTPWKDAVEKFLTEAQDGQKLMLKGLNLTTDDQTWLETSFYGLTNIVWSADDGRLTVIRLSKEDAEKIKDK